MRPLVILALTALVSLSAPSALAAEEEHARGGLAIPSSLQEEHHALHAELARATRLGGRTGAAARALEAAMMPHFEREEEVALPPLGALAALSQGKDVAERAEILEMTGTLRRELPRMLSEHQAIVQKLRQLERAAQAEQRADVVRFARQLAAHAALEEQILYPTSLLIGEYLEPKR